MIEQLEEHLRLSKHKLQGDWIQKNSSYDGDICHILCMKLSKNRYYDAEWNSLCLEFKKGKSIWLDLVRYSEMSLKRTPTASKETITIFFVPNSYKDAIEEIVVVDTKRLIEKLQLTEEIANRLVELNQHVPRQLNAQASLTLNDVKEISHSII